MQGILPRAAVSEAPSRGATCSACRSPRVALGASGGRPYLSATDGLRAPDHGERTQEVFAPDPRGLRCREAARPQRRADGGALAEAFDAAWPGPGWPRVIPLVVTVEVVLFLPLVGEIQSQADVPGTDEISDVDGMIEQVIEGRPRSGGDEGRERA
jgi:hypothetical protein